MEGIFVYASEQSFTTAEVCKDLNRNFIGCDISEKAVSIGLERTKY